MGSSIGSLRIVLLGLDSAGKTTILYRLRFDQYINTIPTIGFNCERIRINNGKAKGTTLLLWDISGQNRHVWSTYTRSSDGIIFVIDSVIENDEKSDEIRAEIIKINESIPLLIFANKQDLPDARETKEIEHILNLKNRSRVHVQPVCAITGDGLYEGLEILIEMIRKKKK